MNLFFFLINFLKEKNQIVIDPHLSQVLYNNKDHVGETIDYFTLKDMTEPNICNLFSNKHYYHRSKL